MVFFNTFPRPPISNFTPTPFFASVAVVTVTLSHNAHRDERASPRNPNEDNVVKEENDVSLEV